MVDAYFRIAYPPTKHKVRGISNEEKNKKGIGEYSFRLSPKLH